MDQPLSICFVFTLDTNKNSPRLLTDKTCSGENIATRSTWNAHKLYIFIVLFGHYKKASHSFVPFIFYREFLHVSTANTSHCQ